MSCSHTFTQETHCRITGCDETQITSIYQLNESLFSTTSGAYASGKANKKGTEGVGWDSLGMLTS